MLRTTVSFTSAMFLVGLLASASHAQLSGLYEFDAGGDGQSWDDPSNWEQVLDPVGLPLSGDPASPPSAITSADVPLSGVVIDSTMPGQTALDLSIGTGAGVGSLSVSGGGVTVRDLFVGRDPGSVNGGGLAMTGGTLIAADDIRVGAGSAGLMTMSGGAMASTADDFILGLGGSLVMTGGMLDVGDRLDTVDDGDILLDGGTIIVQDDLRIFGDGQVTVNSGFMTAADKLYFDLDPTKSGKLTINGGGVRSQEYGLNGDGLGLIEINGSGFYQVAQSELSVAEAMALIAQGVHFITSEPPSLTLDAFSVVVPDFFGVTDLPFTQISIIPQVPEPSTAVLMMLALAWVTARRASLAPRG
jgi:hypothetical protein